MATLFNTKISATYQGLFKTIDNAAITASLKELTDGSGNQSGLYVNTAGDFKVSNILEWGSLKDTGTGVTITRYVTSTDGIENFNNNTSLPTSAAVKLYVDSKFATSDTLQEVLSFGNTTGGKDIVVSAGDDITFTDTSKILMGASSDLQIYHDGANSKLVDGGSGGLFIQTDLFRVLNAAGGKNIIRGTENASVELFYNNSKKLETKNTGVDVTGNLVVSGSITGAGGSFLPLAGGTMTGNIVLNDNVKSIYGTSSDGLEVYHDGTHSYIQDTGTGDLRIKSNSSIALLSNTNEDMIFAVPDSFVKLYFNGIERLATSSTGVSIAGTLSTSSNVSVGANATFVDNGKAIFGAGSDLQIYHNGTNQDKIESSSSFLILESGNLILRNNGGSEDYAKFFGNGGAEIYYDNTKRLETVSAGAKVTGNLEVTGTITGSGGSFLPLAGGTMTGNTIHNDNVKSIYGTASDGLEIYHDGSNSYIADTGTGTLNLRGSTQVLISGANGEVGVQYVENAGVGLRHNNVTKLSTISSGITVTGNGVFSGNVSVPDSAFLYAGSSDDLSLTHNGTDSIIRNYTGDFQINQGAVTKSIVFKVSNANALDTTALTISRNADASFGRNVTIAGDLTVNGTTTTINTQTLAVEDPLIELSKDNTANSVDIGMYGKYNDGTARYLGLFSDASDSNKFKLFKGLTVQPTSTVNIGGAGYVAADLVVAGLEATTGAFSSTGSFGGDVTINNGLISTINATGSLYLNLNYTNSYGGRNFRVSNNGVNYFNIDANALASFAGDVSLVDSKKLLIGIGNDLQISHDGSDSYINNITGNLSIRQLADDKDIIFQSDNGSGGTENYIQIDGSEGRTTFNKNIRLNDNVKAQFGGSGDLQIYHDGSNSFISNIGTGSLIVRATNFAVQSADASDDFITTVQNAQVNLFYNGLKKFETTSTGIQISDTGSVKKIVSYFDGDYTSGFKFSDLNGGIWYDAGADDLYLNANHGNSQIILQSGGSTTLTLDASNNATFEGQINATGEASNGGTINIGDTPAYRGVLSYSGASNTILSIANTYNSANSQINFNLRTAATSVTALSLKGTGNATFAGDVTINGAGSASNGSISLVSSDSFIRINTTGGTTDKGKWDIRTVSASGFEALDFRTVNDANNVFSTKLSIATDGNATFAGEVTLSAETQYLNFKKASTSDILSTIVSETDAGTGGKLRFLTKRNGDTQLNALTLDDNQKATFAGNVAFNDHTIHPDQVKSKFGTGGDASIEHNGSHLFIDNSVGNSYIRNTSTGDILLRNSTGGDIQFDNEAAGNILFNTSNIERMRIEDSGRIRINGVNYDPTSAGGNDTGGFFLTGDVLGNQNYTAGIGFAMSTGASGIAGYQNGSDADRIGLSFFTHGSGTGGAASQESMRIKSGGEVGIGTLQPSSKLFVNDTADGDKIRWGRNDLLVGSVGTFNGVPYIGYQGGAGGGIMFNGANIEPTGIGASRTDNQNDIGSPSHRWRNTYLSGGVFLGGTGSANKLDDYEEGTFTATTNNDGVGQQVTANYRKIGQLVTYTVYIPSWNPTNAGQAVIAGFPFSALTNYGYGVGNVTHSTGVLNCSGGYHETTNWNGTLNNSTGRSSWAVASARSLMVTGFYYTTS